MRMKRIHARTCLIALIFTVPGLAAELDDVHPLMTSEYWGNIGVYFSARNLEASANGSIAGITRVSTSNRKPDWTTDRIS